MTTEPMTREELDQARRCELIAYLESGKADTAARSRLEALPGGAEMLARALAIQAALAPLAAGTPSVDQYLEWKREEIEAERERDERRYGQRP
jgi:hypothetical protein